MCQRWGTLPVTTSVASAEAAVALELALHPLTLLARDQLRRFPPACHTLGALGIALEQVQRRADDLNLRPGSETLFERLDPLRVRLLQHQWLTHRRSSDILISISPCLPPRASARLEGKEHPAVAVAVLRGRTAVPPSRRGVSEPPVGRPVTSSHAASGSVRLVGNAEPARLLPALPGRRAGSAARARGTRASRESAARRRIRPPGGRRHCTRRGPARGRTRSGRVARAGAGSRPRCSRAAERRCSPGARPPSRA